MTKEVLFHSAFGARQDAKKILIILTDGETLGKTLKIFLFEIYFMEEKNQCQEKDEKSLLTSKTFLPVSHLLDSPLVIYFFTKCLYAKEQNKGYSSVTWISSLRCVIRCSLSPYSQSLLVLHV